jgi:hypothetical protein
MSSGKCGNVRLAIAVSGMCDVDWATRFVTHVSASMLHEAQFHVSEGKFDRLVKRFLAMLKNHGGQIDKAYALRNLSIDIGTMNRILLTLHASDMIEEELLGRRKTMITLKTA